MPKAKASLQPVLTLASPRLARGPYVPAPQHAVQRIQQMILKGDIKPGERLPSQRDLSSALGLSRTSLREAISVLETLGFVRSEPGRGVFVCQRGQSETVPDWRFSSRFSEADVYQARLCIEPETAALAAIRLEPRQLKELRRLLERMRIAFEKQAFVEAGAADRDFHYLILESSENRMLIEIWNYMAPVLEESQRRPFVKVALVWETVKEHEELLAALEQRNPQLAHQQMRRHLLGAASRIGVRLPSFFPDL